MSMLDRFKVFTKEPFHPATRGVLIAPSDSSDLDEATRALYVGSDGNIRLTLLDGGDVTLLGLKSGTVLPLRVRKVWTTSTSVSSIIGLY